MMNLLDDEVVAYVVGLAHRPAFVTQRNYVDDLGENELVNLSIEAPHIHPCDTINCIVRNICDICHYPNFVHIVGLEDADCM